MHVFVITLILVYVSSLENSLEYDLIPEGIIVANIKKRASLPLQPGNRRLLDDKNLNYRRTKDIRETSVDRHFEITEALLRQAQREGQLSSAQADDMREDEIKTALPEDDEMRTDIRGEVRENVRDDTKDDVRDDAKDDVRDDAKYDVRDDAKDDVRDDANDDVSDEIRDYIRDGNTRDEVKEEVGDEIKETEALTPRELEPLRNDNEMNSEFLRNDVKKTQVNEDKKDRSDKVQSQFSWLTIESDDGVDDGRRRRDV